jgi:hypothetical protein
MLEREQRRLLYEQRKLESTKRESNLSDALSENNEHNKSNRVARETKKKSGE